MVFENVSEGGRPVVDGASHALYCDAGSFTPGTQQRIKVTTLSWLRSRIWIRATDPILFEGLFFFFVSAFRHNEIHSEIQLLSSPEESTAQGRGRYEDIGHVGRCQYDKVQHTSAETLSSKSRGSGIRLKAT